MEVKNSNILSVYWMHVAYYGSNLVLYQLVSVVVLKNVFGDDIINLSYFIYFFESRLFFFFLA